MKYETYFINETYLDNVVDCCNLNVIFVWIVIGIMVLMGCSGVSIRRRGRCRLVTHQRGRMVVVGWVGIQQHGAYVVGESGWWRGRSVGRVDTLAHVIVGVARWSVACGIGVAVGSVSGWGCHRCDHVTRWGGAVAVRRHAPSAAVARRRRRFTTSLKIVTLRPNFTGLAVCALCREC